MKHKPWQVKYLFGVCGLATFGLAQGAVLPKGPFAYTPLHLQSESVGGAKPNIMLMIDNSGSMNTQDMDGRQTRLQSLKDAMASILRDEKSLEQRWGFRCLNTGTDRYGYSICPTQRGIEDLTKGNRESFIDAFDEIQANSVTPTTSRYLEVAADTAQSIQYRCQKSFIVVLSDGVANGISENQIRYGFNVSPFWQTSLQGSPLSYSEWRNGQFSLPAVANGLDIGFSRGTWVSNQVGQYGLAYPAYKLANTDLKTTGNDTEGGSWQDQDFQQGRQVINTYTIAYGRGILGGGGASKNELAESYLTNGAIYGGGKYYPASSAEDLKKVFTNIATDVSARSAFATVAPAIVSNSSTPDSAVIATLNTGSWSSQLHFVMLGSNGLPRQDAGGAYVFQTVGIPELRSGRGQRRVMLSTDQGVLYFDQGNDFARVVGQANVNQYLNIAPTANQNNAWQNSYRPWLVRDAGMADPQIVAQGKTEGLEYRQRAETAGDPARQMGDLINASIHVMGPKVPAAANRQQFLVTQANDGMVHLFRAKTDNTVAANLPEFKPYELKLNYIPGMFERESTDGSDTILANIGATMNPNYGKNEQYPHKYLLNGGIGYVETVRNPRNERQIFMAGALGQGGRGAYALNVGGHFWSAQTTQALALQHDNQNQWLSDVPLWETNNSRIGYAKDGSEKLGYIFGQPGLARLALQRASTNPYAPNEVEKVVYAAFVPNGYTGDSTAVKYDDEPALYVYNALGQDFGNGGRPYDATEVGRLLKRIPVPAGFSNGATRKGLSAVNLVDTNFDGIADLAYAGDLDGNLYRFDFRGEDSTKWSASLIYKGSKDQPITAAPTVYPRGDGVLVVLFGTGIDLFQTDLTSKTQQSFYGIFDNVTAGPMVTPTALARADLLAQNIEKTETDGQGEVRYVSNNLLDTTKHKGWYLDLPTGTGERVVTQAKVHSRAVYFSTRTYQQDNSQADKVCRKVTSDGYSHNMVLSVMNGGITSPRTGSFVVQRGAQPTLYYSGFKREGIVSASNFVTPTISGVENTMLDVNGNISSGRDGKDGKSVQDGPCVDGWMYAVDSSGGLVKVDVKCGTLGVSVKRLSWREIF